MLHRRLTLDYDGNIRLYSWEEEGQTWVVSWQAIQRPCIIHGVYLKFWLSGDKGISGLYKNQIGKGVLVGLMCVLRVALFHLF